MKMPEKDFPFDSKCGSCGHQFNRNENGGKWINKVWQLDCPGCGVRLGSQTSFWIMPTLETLYKSMAARLAKKAENEA